MKNIAPGVSRRHAPSTFRFTTSSHRMAIIALACAALFASVQSLAQSTYVFGKAALPASGTGTSLVQGADFTETNTCGSSVAGKKSCTISVTFTPSVKGKRTGTLAVSDDGGGSPQNASLTGTGK